MAIYAFLCKLASTSASTSITVCSGKINCISIDDEDQHMLHGKEIVGGFKKYRLHLSYKELTINIVWHCSSGKLRLTKFASVVKRQVNQIV